MFVAYDFCCIIFVANFVTFVAYRVCRSTYHDLHVIYLEEKHDNKNCHYWKCTQFEQNGPGQLK